MKVKVPFMPQFRDALLDGKKLMTCRTKPLGKKGDTFEAFGEEFVIELVRKITLKEVAKHYRLEGLRSPEEFEQLWAKLHPRKGFVPDQEVYAHRIRLVQHILINPGPEYLGEEAATV